MKALLISLFAGIMLSQPSTRIIQMGKGQIGTGSIRVTANSMQRVNIDSLVNLYDTTYLHTPHGITIYVR